MTVLVLHSLDVRSRQTTKDHVLAWGRYLSTDVTYLNLRGPVTPTIREIDWDAVIVNYCYLAHRATAGWREVIARHEPLFRHAKRVLGIAQDDYTYSWLLDEWAVEYADVIHSPIERDLEHIYPRSRGRLPIRHALTGYVEEARLPRLQGFALPWDDRPIDIGQRVRDLPPHYGRAGRRKGNQARMVAAALDGSGLVVDISTDPADVLPGEEWFKFLGACRFTIGRKGGASLSDPDGSVRARVEDFVRRCPDATFEDVELACFPGQDQRADFTAVSPRIFEAAAMGTCQILAPDDYLGCLVPWEHYIPLEDDLSNLDEVLSAMRDKRLVRHLIDRTYQDLIASERFSYRTWVQEVEATDFRGTDLGRATCDDPRLTDHVELAGRLDGLSAQLPEDLEIAARTLINLADLRGCLRELRRLNRAVDELGRAQPGRLIEMGPSDLLKLVPGLKLRGFHPAAGGEVLRQVALAGAGLTMDAWITATADGLLATPHPSATWRSAQSVMLEEARAECRRKQKA